MSGLHSVPGVSGRLSLFEIFRRLLPPVAPGPNAPVTGVAGALAPTASSVEALPSILRRVPTSRPRLGPLPPCWAHARGGP